MSSIACNIFIMFDNSSLHECKTKERIIDKTSSHLKQTIKCKVMITKRDNLEMLFCKRN